MKSTICIRTNHDSVPDDLVGETVIVRMYSEKVVIHDKAHKKVAQHIRSYGKNEWTVDINHYISTLMKMTSAILYSEPFHQMPTSMQVIYHKFFKNNGKEFLKLVKYVGDNDIAYEDVVDAADQIRWNGVRTFTTDNELIIRYVKELKLPTVKDCLEDTIAQALASGWDYRRFLATLL